jgi:putative ABC transport system substrate-binding protein
MRRREFIGFIGSALTAGSVGARAQQATATIGFLSSRSPAESSGVVAPFREGLRESGFIEAKGIAFDT